MDIVTPERPICSNPDCPGCRARRQATERENSSTTQTETMPVNVLTLNGNNQEDSINLNNIHSVRASARVFGNSVTFNGKINKKDLELKESVNDYKCQKSLKLLEHDWSHLFKSVKDIQLLIEYVKFLFVKIYLRDEENKDGIFKTYPDDKVYSVWKQHMLIPQDYVAMCELVQPCTGYIIEHIKPRRSLTDKGIKLMKETYNTLFDVDTKNEKEDENNETCDGFQVSKDILKHMQAVNLTFSEPFISLVINFNRQKWLRKVPQNWSTLHLANKLFGIFGTCVPKFRMKHGSRNIPVSLNITLQSLAIIDHSIIDLVPY